MDKLQDKLPDHLISWQHLFDRSSTAAAIAIREDGAVLAISPAAATFFAGDNDEPVGNSRDLEEFVTRVREAASGNGTRTLRRTQFPAAEAPGGADVRITRITSGSSSTLLARLYPANIERDSNTGFHHMMNLLDSILGAVSHADALRILLRIGNFRHWDYAEAWLPHADEEHMSPAQFHWKHAALAELARMLKSGQSGAAKPSWGVHGGAGHLNGCRTFAPRHPEYCRDAMNCSPTNCTAYMRCR